MSLNRPLALLTLVAVLCQQVAQIASSGVFELELLSLEQLDLRSSQQNNLATSLKNQTDLKLVKVFVCLKEPFTSKLDGPCTFGNASIVFLQTDQHNQRHSQSDQLQQTKLQPPTNQTNLARSQQHADRHTDIDTPMTNSVRISFTFRWMKSFTIILTGEQTQNALDNNPANRQEPPTESVTVSEIKPQSDTQTQATPAKRKPSNAPSLANRAPISQLQQQQQASPFIDRHVLTEHEVVPNLELNPNKPWTSRFSRSLKSSIAYRFRVYCSLNYYGDGCNTFCRARDDQFGHYNCSLAGHKICLEGWQGADCDKAKCREGCNEQHGHCDKPDTCQCRPGWTGAHCDQCVAYPGCANGYCLSPWQCLCRPNWGGVLCDQELDFCASHEPCKNNATCQNTGPAKYKCNCAPGFAGPDCDLASPLGAMSNTTSGQQQQQQQQQQVQQELEQPRLGYSACLLNGCQNGGTCFGYQAFRELGGSFGAVRPAAAADLGLPFDIGTEPEELTNQLHYRCQCLPGWTGDYCQWPDAGAISLADLIASQNQSQTQLPIANITDIVNQTIANLKNADRLVESRQQTSPNVMADNIHTMPAHHGNRLDMRHIISGVMIASVVGVFLASLLLAWCCLLAVKQNCFSFIHMSIIRGAGAGAADNESAFEYPAPIASRLRRVHERIRNSLRSSRISTSSKLSIENVLRPPPSYEESKKSKCLEHIYTSHTDEKNEKPQCEPMCRSMSDEANHKTVTNENNPTPTSSLVIRGALGQELACSKLMASNHHPVSRVESTNTSPSALDESEHSSPEISAAQLTCPRHGHLYRQHMIESTRIPASSNGSVTINVRHQNRLPFHDHFHDFEV